MNLTKLDKKIIRALQEDFPLSSEPYKEIADELGLDEELLLNRLQFFVDSGIIRRFGAALKHRELGFKANAMVVWKVPSSLTKNVGSMMAQFSEVSHCYERPILPEWPYNMFTMIHGSTPKECEVIAKRISKKVDIKEYELLFSTQELKKASMKYFCE